MDSDRIVQQMQDNPARKMHQEIANQALQSSLDSIKDVGSPISNSIDDSEDSITKGESSGAESPFQDVTTFPASENSSSTMNSRNSNESVSSTPPASSSEKTTNSRNQTIPVQNPFVVGEKTNSVTVIMKGFSRGDTVRHMRDLRTAAESFRMRPENIGDGESRIIFDAIKDIQTFADRISFGKVTNVDTTTNEITIKKQ